MDMNIPYFVIKALDFERKSTSLVTLIMKRWAGPRWTSAVAKRA
jgi:hypothetical protein